MNLSVAERLGQLLLVRNQSVTAAESCTGGLVCGAITDVAGSSSWFERGFVVYSNQAKHDMLAVPQSLLEAHGAVSAQVVEALAQQAKILAGADWAVAISGVAGPAGGSAEKPVGLVWFGWAGPKACKTESCRFDGDRAAVRAQAVQHALTGLVNLIEEQA